jgi:hypothetical protein
MEAGRVAGMSTVRVGELTALIAAGLLAVCATAGCSAISLPGSPGKIDGKLYAVKGWSGPKVRAPLGNHSVWVIDSTIGSGIVAQTVSAADGSFRFSLPSGEYAVGAGERVTSVHLEGGQTVHIELEVRART